MPAHPKKKLNYFVKRVGGNYIGPGWSDGQYQDSVAYGKTKPTSKLDVAAYRHDTSYARGENLDRADQVFVQDALRSGHPARYPTAIAVAAQRKLRRNNYSASGFSRKPKIFPENANDYHPTSFPENKPVDEMSKRGRSLTRTPSKTRSTSRKSRSPPGAPRKRLFRGRSSVSPVKRRRFGAASSKSMGKLKKGRKLYTGTDYFSRKGIVVQRENMGVYTTTAAEKAQSMLIGHSCFSFEQFRWDMAFAMAKMIAQKCSVQIQTVSDTLPFGFAGYTWQLVFYYRPTVGASESNVSNVFTSTNTWQDVINWIRSVIATVSDTAGNNDPMLTRIKANNLLQPAGNATTIFECDLTRARIQCYVKSNLKLQNRTVSVAGNVEEDDVDNVPVYGKMYSGSGNYFIHQDIVYSVSNGSVSDGPLALYKFQVGSPLQEPQALSFIKKANKIAKVHMDPGHIKTNVIIFRKTYSLNYLINGLSNPSGLSNTRNMVNLGKFSFIHVEKLLQAVATTDANAMTLAYELDHTTGIICTAPKVRQTNVVAYTQSL